MRKKQYQKNEKQQFKRKLNRNHMKKRSGKSNVPYQKKKNHLFSLPAIL